MTRTKTARKLMRLDEIKRKYPKHIVRLVQTKQGWFIRRSVAIQQKCGKNLSGSKTIYRLLAVYPAA